MGFFCLENNVSLRFAMVTILVKIILFAMVAILFLSILSAPLSVKGEISHPDATSVDAFPQKSKTLSVRQNNITLEVESRLLDSVFKDSSYERNTVKASLSVESNDKPMKRNIYFSRNRTVLASVRTGNAMERDVHTSTAVTRTLSHEQSSERSGTFRRNKHINKRDIKKVETANNLNSDHTVAEDLGAFEALTDFREHSSRLSKMDSWAESIKRACNGTNATGEFPISFSRSLFCTASWQCNTTLNERCIIKDPYPECGCGKSFARDPVSGICQGNIMLNTSMRFPEENYKIDLENSQSRLYKRTREAANATMWLLLETSPLLKRMVTNFEVIQFGEGSLIIYWRLTLVSSTNSALNISNIVERELKKGIKSKAVRFVSPLSLQDVDLLEVSTAINPCSHSELNYCSKNAVCIESDSEIGEYSCACKEGYTDVSPNTESYHGEVCTEYCPPEYCGYYGTCLLKSNGVKYCMCSSWYVGSHCQVPAAVVVAGSCAICIFFMVVLFGFCWLYISNRKKVAEQIIPNECETGMNNLVHRENKIQTPDLQPQAIPKLAKLDDVPVVVVSQHNASKSMRTTPSLYSFYESTFDTPVVSSDTEDYHL